MRGVRSAKSGGTELRRQAEKRLEARKPAPARRHDEDLRRLVHELEVHQIELEIQNEELDAAGRDIEAGLRRYSEIFEFAPIGYFVIATDGTIRESNLAGARLLGAERMLLVGDRFVRFVQEGQRGTFADFLERVLVADDGEGNGVSCEVQLAGEVAPARDLGLTGAVVGNAPRAALIAALDLTARKRAEAALREENRRKDAFLGTLSHELRNPLAPISNSLSVIERSEPGSERARRALAVIARQVAHLTRIVDDLLDATRIAHDKIRLQKQRVDLRALVQHTMDDYRQGFQSGGIQLDTHLEQGTFWVDADATRLAQVLGNLLTNAVKFTPSGGKVEVFLRREARTAALSVRDNGIGIGIDTREHLFEPFWQAPQTLDRSRGGLGLGLAMVKRIVEMHGGAVNLTSDGVERGAEFLVRLPLVVESSQDACASTPRAAQRYRVLVIEDLTDAADTLRGVLELEGHSVRVAGDGYAGLALARQFRPEVVLCDIGLPGMDGYQVARAFREDDLLKGTFLVALSGYALPEDLRRALLAGFDRHIAKPASVDSLEHVFAQIPAPGDRRSP